MSKNKSRYAKRPVSQTSRRLMEDLAEVDDLIERKRWQEALNILEPLEERYPERAEVLLCLLMVYGEQEAAVPMLRVALKLARVKPREPEVDLALASAYTMNFHVVLALDAFHRFLQRWPNHPEVSSARQSLAEIEQHLDAHLAETGFTRDELELARWFDEAEVSVEQDRIPQALATYQKLLNRKPDHAPALINISRLHALEGRYDQAIAAAQRALVSDPENADAHANLARFLCVTGRADEARQHAEQLKLFQSGGADGWTCKPRC